jgi:hypothetical protein
VPTAKQEAFWPKLLALLGGGYLVAAGYMDPGGAPGVPLAGVVRLVRWRQSVLEDGRHFGGRPR